MPGLDPAVKKGEAKALQYRGIRYATWSPGKDWVVWPNAPLPSYRHAESSGGVCTSVGNVYRIANGLDTPEWVENGIAWVKGGTGAWGKRYSLHPFVLGKHYPRGTLFIEPYSGTALSAQGHVSVSIEDGDDPLLVQSYLSRGWNSDDRLSETHAWAKFTHYCLPSEWLT